MSLPRSTVFVLPLLLVLVLPASIFAQANPPPPPPVRNAIPAGVAGGPLPGLTSVELAQFRNGLVKPCFVPSGNDNRIACCAKFLRNGETYTGTPAGN